MSFTICPNEIMNDARIDGNAYRVWSLIAQYDSLKGWKHITKVIAKTINLCVKTVLSKIKTLISLGYLGRKPKTNGEFGYIYFIPEKYRPKNFTREKKNGNEKEATVCEDTMEKSSTNNKKEHNKTEQLNKTDINQGVDDENKKFDSKDNGFVNWVQSNYPKVKNVGAYLHSKCKETGQLIGNKLWQQYQSKDVDISQQLVTAYRNGKLKEVNWQEVLPEYKRWHRFATTTNCESNFVDNNSFGGRKMRNARILFWKYLKNTF